MRVAIVTGVSRGLGEALALRLLAGGFRVLGIGRANSARLAGGAYAFAEADLADAARVAQCGQEHFGALARTRPEFAVLINNAAAVDPVGRFGAMPDAALARAIAVNLTAPALLANAFCRAFPGPDGERRIVNVSSGLAQRTMPGTAHYSVAKAGLEMLTTTLATDHRDPGFRAISIRPGVIDTGMQAFIRAQSAESLPEVPMFQAFHRSGQLVPPDVTAGVIVDRLVQAPVEHGRTYTYQELAA